MIPRLMSTDSLVLLAAAVGIDSSYKSLVTALRNPVMMIAAARTAATGIVGVPPRVMLVLIRVLRVWRVRVTSMAPQNVVQIWLPRGALRVPMQRPLGSLACTTF